MTTPEPDFDPDVPATMMAGRRYPFVVVPEWVPLAVDPKTGKRLSTGARAMYDLLKMHVNQSRGDNIVWPGTAVLAELTGLSRADKVKAHMDPLVRINAVEVRVYRWGPRAEKSRNLYIIHETPPPGYQGFNSLAEFYAAREEHRAELEEATERVKRGAPEIGAPGLSRKNPRSSPETPKRGVPDTPETGAPAPPETGHQPHEDLNHGNYKGQEEEAARAREEESPVVDEEPAEELPQPSLFALISIRQIIDEAPQTTGRGASGRVEIIGEFECYELARMFDAETQQLAEAGVLAPGSDLSGWLSRGLETANSLYAVLRSRLKPGHATTRITRPKPPTRTPQPQPDAPEPEREPDTCSVHDGATPGQCPTCEQEREAARAAHERAMREQTRAARASLAAQGFGTKAPQGVDA